jgi:two-component system cell cycle sensor histidine kinase/response regulator CckA
MTTGAFALFAGLVLLLLALVVLTVWLAGRRQRQSKKEAALLETDEAFRLMIESITDYAIIMLDPTGMIVTWNQGAERIKGYRPEEIIGQHFSRFYPEEALARGVPQSHLEVAARDGRSEEEGWRIRKDGSLFWASVVITALREKSGKLRGYSKVTRDLTQRMQVEKELRWKNALLEAQVRCSLDGIMVVDGDQKKILQNQRVNELWKIPPDIAADPDATKQLEWVTNMAKDPELFLENVLYLKNHPEELSRSELELQDGTILDRYSAPIVGSDGEYYGRISTFRDITDRKRAEEKLRRLSLEHELILNAVGEGVHWIGQDGRIRFENPASAKMLGYEGDELIGQQAHSTMHHTRADGTAYPVSECPIYTSLKTGVAYRVKDEIFWRKDGTRFPVEYTCTPVRIEDGTLAGSVVVFTDISERKRIEERLFQSQKMETVGKLAGGVAHEFNSILTAIIGQSELILNDLDPESAAAKSAVEIHQAADRAAGLTRQLLAYGRKQILQPRVLDLNLVLAEMEGTLTHLMGEAQVNIVTSAGAKTVKIDPGQMEQVIVNIAMNAATAMPNGGRLTLETSAVVLDENFVRPYPGLVAGDYVLLAISDTGSGMKEEIKAHIFEPFFSTKGVGQGPGLGLATCYGIVKQSGGHINVYSELARGSTFKIYLPRVEPGIKVPIPRATPTELPRGTETILLAEDDPALLEMSSTLLRKLGYNVLTAADGVEALALRNKRDVGHIDLLFTDVVMPHMSGKELSDRFRTIYPNTKILFTSAYTENAVVHQGILNEGVTLLQKPFTPAALANKVREMLDQ